MNRKGDIAFTLLVVISLVASLALLATFVYYNQSNENMPNEISEMMVEVEAAQEYAIGETQAIGMQVVGNSKDGDLKGEFMAVAAERDASVQSFGNFFLKIRNGDFSFDIQPDGSYLIKIENVFVQSKKGMNAIRRDFNVSVLLNSEEFPTRDISKFGYSERQY